MVTSTVEALDTGSQKVSRRVRVNAPAAEIYALLADPHRHPELDGSGTIRDVPITGPRRVAPGDTFTVGMKQYGVPYKITSTVTVAQDDRVIEWQHPLGHRWRWELTQVAPDATEVTETFDYSTAKAPLLITMFGMHRKNADGIASTLRRLAERYAAPS
ncbi:SRPBCC family protein [Mycobacterium sp. CPCC 205372]|uniref:SRPBCC family protein n=1 Tax=Mycobacterium hippophais TaxID=3016340 RepID=A0ABT4PVV2_9MYCO|nr:SRPBCC family protein [Mycobacterium hippophais]MCZ8380707.1 SRPBCC family protein [Mycobacterium hippophais]